jgi:hypothetical protein
MADTDLYSAARVPGSDASQSQEQGGRPAKSLAGSSPLVKLELTVIAAEKQPSTIASVVFATRGELK